MKIKINEENMEALQTALNAVQTSRMSVNLVTPTELVEMAQEADNAALKLLPVSKHTGAVYEYCAAGPYAKRYQYTQQATAVTLYRGTGSWYLTKVARVNVYPKQRERRTLILPTERADDILNHVMRDAGATLDS